MVYKVSLSDTEIRRLLEREVGELPDDGWEVLRRKRYIQEVHKGLLSIEDLAKEVRELRLIGANTKTSESKVPLFVPTRRQRRSRLIAPRQEAISLLTAELARGRRDVQEFREMILANQLIAWQDLETWLDGQRSLSERHVMVKIPAGSRLFRKEGHWTVDPPITTDLKIGELSPLEVLVYVTSDHETVNSVPVGSDGPLRLILDLSRSLSAEYGWEVAQATVFLLCDCTPVVSLFRATATYNMT